MLARTYPKRKCHEYSRRASLIESYERRVRGYDGRIEKMERDISKNRSSIEEYHNFIELGKEQ